MGVACSEKVKPEGGGGKPITERVSELNGTAIDVNSNMIGIVKDTNGNPLAGIPVTDGYNYVTTDENGVYQIAGSRYARKAYLSFPAGYEIPLDEETHLPIFFSPGTIVRANQNRFDFTLKPLEKEEEDITLVMISDPQCQVTSDVTRYKNETIPAIQAALTGGNYPNPYAFTLGDITHDSTDQWENMKGSMSNVKLGANYLPFFQCIGNHDHNSNTQTDFDSTADFFKHFGPVDYSINRGNVHIITMDDIIVSATKTNSSPNKATWQYDGGFTDAQWKWLQQDLALVENKQDKMVIICLHIPFRGGSTSGGGNVNKGAGHYTEVLAALKAFKEAHIMIGHTHYSQNYIHSSYRCKNGLPIYEHIHGAACGAWWCSNSNTDGTPNGFGIYEIDAKNAAMKNWHYKSTNMNKDFQLRVYDGTATYTGTKGYHYRWTQTQTKELIEGETANWWNTCASSGIFAKGNASLKNAFVVDIWNDDNTYWTVDFVQDGVKKGSFNRLGDGTCCDVLACSFYYNEKGKTTDSYNKSTASHYWYYVPESGNPTSEKNWEVVATQTIPGTTVQNVYKNNAFTADYGTF